MHKWCYYLLETSLNEKPHIVFSNIITNGCGKVLFAKALPFNYVALNRHWNYIMIHTVTNDELKNDAFICTIAHEMTHIRCAKQYKDLGYLKF